MASLEVLVPSPSLGIIAAYASSDLAYDAQNRIVRLTEEQLKTTPRNKRLNLFCNAYKPDAPIVLQTTLAKIVREVGRILHEQQSWKLVVFDGLRVIETGLMLERSRPDLVEAGLLALAGTSAHNRALAVDCTPFDAEGCEIDLGGHFDCEDMETNHRNYDGAKISATAKENRIIFERAFQRASAANGTLIAPLRSEFWDFRPPGTPKDLWRVAESIARCIGVRDETSVQKLKAQTDALSDDHEIYECFIEAWQEWFAPYSTRLHDLLGTHNPPALENFIFHERMKNIWNAQLPANMQTASDEAIQLAKQTLPESLQAESPYR